GSKAAAAAEAPGKIMDTVQTEAETALRVPPTDVGEHATGDPDELMSKPRWQRAVISAAGPAVNLVFPILLLTVYFVAIGIPYPIFENKPVVVTAVPANSAAAHAGLAAGDRVAAINSQSIPTWT